MAIIGAILGAVLLWFHVRALKNLLLEYPPYWRKKREAVRIKRELQQGLMLSEMELRGAYEAYFIGMLTSFRGIDATLAQDGPAERYTQVPEGYGQLSGKWVPNVVMGDIAHLSLSNLPEPRSGAPIAPHDLLAAYERHKPEASFIYTRVVLILIGLGLLLPSLHALNNQ